MLAPLGWGFLRRLGDPPVLAALMHNNLATVHHELGQREAAIRDYEAALALLDRYAPDGGRRMFATSPSCGPGKPRGPEVRSCR